MTQHIFTFDPIYKPTIWGGNRIASFKNEKAEASNVGESWEISAVPGHSSVVTNGENKGLTLIELCQKYTDRLLGRDSIGKYGEVFPLLVKIIDAADDLSVQVHPDDALAQKRHNSRGKTEMWYIIDREPGALIRCGFRSAVDPARLDTLVAEGRFSDCLGRYESAPSDVFFIPAGRVHSIGKGNLLCEIQESSDITYRIDDFNRRDSNGNLRELHLDLAKDAIDYSVSDNCRSHAEPVPGSVTTIIDSPFFITDLLSMQPGESQSLDSIDSFLIVVCLDGEVSLMTNGGEAVTLSRGHSALVAASCEDLKLSTGNSGCSILLSHV